MHFPFRLQEYHKLGLPSQILSRDGWVVRMVNAMNESIEAARHLNRPAALGALTLSFDLLGPDRKGKPIGWMSPEVIAKSQDALIQCVRAQKKLPVTDCFTNDFVQAN